MGAGEFERVAADSPYLRSVSTSSRERLAGSAREVAFGRGRVLFLEGEAPDYVYLVRRGLIRLFVAELDGSDTTVRIAGAGELVGELAVLDGGLRSASAVALRAGSAFRLPAEHLAAELPADGTVGRGVLRGLVSLVRDNTKRLVIERSHRLESIVARLVLDDPALLRRVTQGELAGLLGASRQSLNQILRAWERDGLIVRRDGRMHLSDPATLESRYLTV